MATKQLKWKHIHTHVSDEAAVTAPTGANPPGATLTGGSAAKGLVATGGANYVAIHADTSLGVEGLVTFEIWWGWYTASNVLWAIDKGLGGAGTGLISIAATTDDVSAIIVEAPGDCMFIRPVTNGAPAILTVNVFAGNLGE